MVVAGVTVVVGAAAVGELEVAVVEVNDGCSIVDEGRSTGDETGPSPSPVHPADKQELAK